MRSGRKLSGSWRQLTRRLDSRTAVSTTTRTPTCVFADYDLNPLSFSRFLRQNETEYRSFRDLSKRKEEEEREMEKERNGRGTGPRKRNLTTINEPA